MCTALFLSFSFISFLIFYFPSFLFFCYVSIYPPSSCSIFFCRPLTLSLFLSLIAAAWGWWGMSVPGRFPYTKFFFFFFLSFQNNKETRDNWIGLRLNRPENLFFFSSLKVKAKKKRMARVWGRWRGRRAPEFAAAPLYTPSGACPREIFVLDLAFFLFLVFFAFFSI